MEAYVNKYADFQSAYLGSLSELRSSGSIVASSGDRFSVGSEFGKHQRTTKEMMMYSFIIDNPRNRVIFDENRRLNLPFAMANAVWMLLGSNSLEFINFYNARGTFFSDDGSTLHGAHGKRIFNTDGINQVRGIVERLRRDPFSRRTVSVIYHPVDNVTESKDIPCAIAIQFLQRDGKLHAMVFMRSQSAAMVLPYDVFAFTFLQEFLATELKLEIGYYYHTSASFHYYLDEEELIERIINNGKLTSSSIFDPPKMPRDYNNHNAIQMIAEFEKAYRMNGQVNLDYLRDVPNYWRDVAFILATKIAMNAGDDYLPFITALQPYYRRFFAE
jgi:thymidylate synthase